MVRPFHVFGYDPARMMEHFDAIWVGTECAIADAPHGFRSATEVINFRWLRSSAAKRWLARGSITSSAALKTSSTSLSQRARRRLELTFSISATSSMVIQATPPCRRLPDLRRLSDRVRQHEVRGIPYTNRPAVIQGKSLPDGLSGHGGLADRPGGFPTHATSWKPHPPPPIPRSWINSKPR